MKNLLYIDLFCGAGGTSTGVNSARLNGEQCAKVIACVNHDKNAIASHAANHPEALVVLWASLECTNFSKAKGGQPRDADSRTLAEHLFRYIEVYSTDSPMTAKIKEFMALYGIIDIKMRMLKIPELKKIMGFPEDYVLVGSQADQKKFIGNAVEVTIARAWCEALCMKLSRTKKNIA